MLIRLTLYGTEIPFRGNIYIQVQFIASADLSGVNFRNDYRALRMADHDGTGGLGATAIFLGGTGARP